MSTCRSKLLLALTILLPSLAGAQPLSNTLGFSARIADAGTPVTGAHEFVFNIWSVESGGVAGTDDLFVETLTLTVNDGVVTAALGAAGVFFPANLFDGSDRWLEVSMDGIVFGPRMAVRAVPYAMRATVADSMNKPLSCTVAVGTEYSIAAGGKCPSRFPCLCLPGFYCPCDECFSGTCPAGYTVTGGGYWAGNSTENFNVLSSIPFGSDRWKLRVVNNAATTLLLTPYAQCCKVP